jgi:hypothetical protein
MWPTLHGFFDIRKGGYEGGRCENSLDFFLKIDVQAPQWLSAYGLEKDGE